jgi:SpoVK/Ycf46/Vps4 family AAA+-type ATPase
MPLRQSHLVSSSMRGILLYGPPGTGKTLLAKVIAKESGYAFFNVTPSSILNMYQGESERRLNQLFDTARNHAPSVLFFDEIDSIGGSRRADHSHSVLNQLLINMDGVTSSSKVIVIGASNRPWMLDDALRRRLTLNVYIPLPKDIYKLLVHCLKKYPFEETDGLVAFADTLVGYSGADVENLCRIANIHVLKSANRYKIREDGFYESVQPCDQCMDGVKTDENCLHCMSYKMDVLEVPKDKLILRKMNLTDLEAARSQIIINRIDVSMYESFGNQ